MDTRLTQEIESLSWKHDSIFKIDIDCWRSRQFRKLLATMASHSKMLDSMEKRVDQPRDWVEFSPYCLGISVLRTELGLNT